MTVTKQYRAWLRKNWNRTHSKKYGELLKVRELMKCDLCGFLFHKSRLDVDHIKPKSLYPELVHDVNNMRLLCRVCNKTRGNKLDRLETETEKEEYRKNRMETYLLNQEIYMMDKAVYFSIPKRIRPRFKWPWEKQNDKR